MTQALDSIIAAQQCSEALGSRIKVVTCSNSSSTANCSQGCESFRVSSDLVLYSDVFQHSSGRPLKKMKQYLQVFMCCTTAVNPEMSGMYSAQLSNADSAAYCKHVYLCSLWQSDTPVWETNSHSVVSAFAINLLIVNSSIFIMDSLF